MPQIGDVFGLVMVVGLVNLLGMEDESMITQDIVKQTTHQRIVVARHGGPEVLQCY